MATFDFTPPKLPRPKFKYEDSVMTRKYLSQQKHFFAKASNARTERSHDRYFDKAEAAYAKASQYSIQLNRSGSWHD